MSIPIPIRRSEPGPAPTTQQPPPPPVFTLMAATQMNREGRLVQPSPEPQKPNS